MWSRKEETAPPAAVPGAALFFEVGSSRLCLASACRSLFIRHPPCSAPKAADLPRGMQRGDALRGSSRPDDKKGKASHNLVTSPSIHWLEMLRFDGKAFSAARIAQKKRPIRSHRANKGARVIRFSNQKCYGCPKNPGPIYGAPPSAPQPRKAKSRTFFRSALCFSCLMPGNLTQAGSWPLGTDQFSFVSVFGASLEGSLLVIALPRNRSSAAMSWVSLAGSVAT